MPKKSTLNIRDDFYEMLFLEEGNSSISWRINSMIRDFDTFVRFCQPKLTRNQWRAALDANNGVVIDWGDNVVIGPGMFAANVRDTPSLAQQHGIDVPDLVNRMMKWTAAESLAFAELCRRFWARQGDIDVVGIVPHEEIK